MSSSGYALDQLCQWRRLPQHGSGTTDDGCVVLQRMRFNTSLQLSQITVVSEERVVHRRGAKLGVKVQPTRGMVPSVLSFWLYAIVNYLHKSSRVLQHILLDHTHTTNGLLIFRIINFSPITFHNHTRTPECGLQSMQCTIYTYASYSCTYTGVPPTTHTPHPPPTHSHHLPQE